MWATQSQLRLTPKEDQHVSNTTTGKQTTVTSHIKISCPDKSQAYECMTFQVHSVNATHAEHIDNYEQECYLLSALVVYSTKLTIQTETSVKIAQRKR